ncbi:MAG: hypothetical protein R2711_09845 [Acidimicrobiales bacterium]
MIVLDSPVAEPDHEVEASRPAAFGVPRLPDGRNACARFRTIPPRTTTSLRDAPRGRRSLHAVEGGWSWKFDHDLFSAFTSSIRAVALPYLPQVTCRFALLRAEHGLVTPDIGQSMYERLGNVAPVVRLPSGPPRDARPALVLITAIRTLLADWDHSTPQRR